MRADQIQNEPDFSGPVTVYPAAAEPPALIAQTMAPVAAASSSGTALDWFALVPPVGADVSQGDAGGFQNDSGYRLGVSQAISAYDPALFGYSGDAFVVDENGAKNVTPNYLDWFLSRGFYPVECVYVGQHYRAVLNSSGEMVSGTLFRVDMNDAIFWLFAQIMVGVVTAGVSSAGLLGGSSVGDAVLGSNAADYPSLSNAISRASLSTALNGGDVKAAVISTIRASLGDAVGVSVGGATADATGIDSLGDVAQKVTAAYIQTGDASTAAKNALIQYGLSGYALASTDPLISDYPDALSNGDPYSPDPVAFQEGTSAGLDFSASPAAAAFFVPDLFPISSPDNQGLQIMDASNYSGDPYNPGDNFLPSVPYVPIDSLFPVSAQAGTPPLFAGSTLTQDGAQSYAFPSLPTMPDTPPAAYSIPSLFPSEAGPQPAPPANSDFSLSSVTNGISNAAGSVLKLIVAAKTIQQTARSVSPTGAVRVASVDGMVYTRQPNGQTTSAPMPVGTAQATLDGSYVVNNGNGTFTVVSPSGSSVTKPYATGTAGAAGSGLAATLTQNPALLAGLGLVAVLLLKRK